MSTQAVAQLEVDTIVAIATPPGRGGIGIVRLSGPLALAIARRIVRLRGVPVARQVHYGSVRDAEGRRLDDALLTWFAAPASYTGEDVVEIATHGAPVVLQAVVAAALQDGARLARPGEFTERAYFAGKLDLTAAEAVRDLIDAQTTEQARLAARQMGGSLAREVAPVKRGLLELVATLEAGIDFAEDDLETLPAAEIHARVAALLLPLRRLEGSFARGRLLREGLKLAIAGKPNAGKSSLFNRLLGRDRAIVTPIAGTTRDVVSEPLVIEGVPIQLLDTAGLRETEDAVERIGVARSREAMADADLVLHLVDAAEFMAAAEAMEAAGSLGGQEWLAGCSRTTTGLATAGSPWVDALFDEGMAGVSAAPMLRVLTKVDLLSPSARADLQRPLEGRPTVLLTSALTGEGMSSLQAAVVRSSAVEDGTLSRAMLTNLRQHRAVAAAVLALARAEGSPPGTPHEMLLLDLYDAMGHLDEFTGTTANEDVLALIFSTFCIGK